MFSLLQRDSHLSLPMPVFPTYIILLNRLSTLFVLCPCSYKDSVFTDLFYSDQCAESSPAGRCGKGLYQKWCIEGIFGTKKRGRTKDYKTLINCLSSQSPPAVVLSSAVSFPPGQVWSYLRPVFGSDLLQYRSAVLP